MAWGRDGSWVSGEISQHFGCAEDTNARALPLPLLALVEKERSFTSAALLM